MRKTARPSCLGPALMVGGLLALGVSSAAAQDFDREDPRDENMATGPAIGERIPDFAGIDQHGRRVSWSEIRGPRGALILFYRSADW